MAPTLTLRQQSILDCEAQITAAQLAGDRVEFARLLSILRSLVAAEVAA